MTLDKKITLCENLTPVEVRIGNYIMNHKETILNCTIQDLEKEVFVSKSAIHRFCKKIGLNGFNDLKIELAKEEKMEEETGLMRMCLSMRRITQRKLPTN